jgi:cell division septum initiation protein DivIVA
MKEKRAKSAMNKLPEYLKIIRDLQKRVDELEKKLSEQS